jgi:hypothetical protein
MAGSVKITERKRSAAKSEIKFFPGGDGK